MSRSNKRSLAGVEACLADCVAKDPEGVAAARAELVKKDGGIPSSHAVLANYERRTRAAKDNGSEGRMRWLKANRRPSRQRHAERFGNTVVAALLSGMPA